MKILLSTLCGGGNVTMEYMQDCLTKIFLCPERLEKQERYNFHHYTVAGNSGLGKDRGIIASYALRNGYDKLLFIDNDQQFTWEQVKMLVDSDKKIIAAVIPMKDFPIRMNFTPYPHDMPELDKATAVEGLKNLVKKYKDPEIKVLAIGTGMVCIDVSVLRKMTENCPRFTYADNLTGKRIWCWDFLQTGVFEDVYYGEDAGFSVQAIRAGLDIHINATCLVNHIGRFTYKIGQELTYVNPGGEIAGEKTPMPEVSI